MAILLLLLIPAINIVTLNMANVDNYSDEIALKRALGAGLWDSFMQVITEIACWGDCPGAILGIFLTYPVADWISVSFFFDNGDEGQISLIEDLDYLVILCGGVSSLVVVYCIIRLEFRHILCRENIATVLKGGSK